MKSWRPRPRRARSALIRPSAELIAADLHEDPLQGLELGVGEKRQVGGLGEEIVGRPLVAAARLELWEVAADELGEDVERDQPIKRADMVTFPL
jgi:hypothetical protein